LSSLDPDAASLRCRVRRRRDGVVVIRVAGQVDWTTGPVLRELLTAAVSGSSLVTVVDLSDVDFIDCYGIGLIIAARNTALARGGSLRVDGLNGEPERVFEVLGLRPSLTTWSGNGEGGRDVRELEPARRAA